MSLKWAIISCKFLPTTPRHKLNKLGGFDLPGRRRRQLNNPIINPITYMKGKTQEIIVRERCEL